MITVEKGDMSPKVRKPQFYVGVKQNSDGTRDYSQAMEMISGTEKLAEEIATMERDKKEARKQWLAIPDNVKPGSAAMVWQTMRNTIYINKEAAQKARENGKPDAHREALIQEQEMQQIMFNTAQMRFDQDLIKESLDTDQTVSAEQAQEKGRNLSALEMYDLVQKYIVDYYEILQDECHDDPLYYQYYKIKDLLRIARDLQNRLIDEASRNNTK